MNITTPEDIFKYQFIPDKNSPKEIYRFWRQDGRICYEYFDNSGRKYRAEYYSNAESLFDLIKHWVIYSDIPSVHNQVAAKIQELSKRFEQRPKKQAEVESVNWNYTSTVSAPPRAMTYNEMVTYVTGRW